MSTEPDIDHVRPEEKTSSRTSSVSFWSLGWRTFRRTSSHTLATLKVGLGLGLGLCLDPPSRENPWLCMVRDGTRLQACILIRLTDPTVGLSQKSRGGWGARSDDDKAFLDWYPLARASERWARTNPPKPIKHIVECVTGMQMLYGGFVPDTFKAASGTTSMSGL